ncbi:hypothetical protein HUN08_12690 [Gordonia sp. X0973]|uniref:hypothetical protein n=1 Tax=Gordonia sp. X0973 TaxID=2742602 RepID=UPI000F549B58|nr:hypothetical protein [Gordonia sp. X0973]QKT07948.1 hypothetical protein HUN08_12690 [Gordonia sp. X0973]
MRLSPVDARMLWSAPDARSDLFLLYAFDRTETRCDDVAAGLVGAASRIWQCNVVLAEVPGHLDYPSWVPRPVSAEDVVVHPLADATWSGLLTAVGTLIADQVEPRRRPWRLHLFDAVDGPSEVPGRLRVVVLQISHALADGRGASAIARALLGDAGPTAATPEGASPGWVAATRGALRIPGQALRLVVDGVRAYRSARRDETDVGPGTVAPAAVNSPAGRRRELRTLTIARTTLGPRVTVGAIAAIGAALSAAGLVEGEPVVELTLARDPDPGQPHQANNFFMAGVPTRAAAIEAAIDAARARDAAPARVAGRRAEAATPAALMHWAVTGFGSGGAPEAVTGYTVVSSVNRGAADLRLAGGAVRMTAGFPALSTTHALTHGVHGIGPTVTISVLADPDVVDVDAYVAYLREANSTARS